MRKRTNLKEILEQEGWTPHGLYGLKSPSFRCAQTFIADVYNEHKITMYIGKSTVVQDGVFVCIIHNKRDLMTFINLMKRL